MQEPFDAELLRQYAEQDSESAFAALVTRHVNLVYSAAVRKTRNPHAAEEITQAVFIILAKKAQTLRRETVLSGWLYQTARLTAANFLRGEIRRVRREQESYMQSLSNETGAWPQIEPLLDDAMGRLNEKERNAIVLRFFEGKSFQEIGAAFGGTENAAKKRVIHGLEKLRKFFAKRGVDSTAATIAETISANSIQAAPAALAKAVTAVAIAKGATASTSTLTLIKGALKIMAWTKAKTAIVVGAGVLLAAGTATVTVREIEAKQTLTIRMRVDGSDFLRVSGNQLWFEHSLYQLPDTIYVNGSPWSPTWNGDVSTKYTGLKPAFNPSNPQRIELAVAGGRGMVSIAQLPATTNQQTLSVLIDDKDYDGQDWYEFTISW